MPTSFLDLPREIRDEVYTYLLISPTGQVSPIQIQNPHNVSKARSHSPTSSPSNSQSPAPFRLYTNQPDAQNSKSNPKVNKPYLSLSIQRTCTQIHHETRDLFWSHNTFTFSSPNTFLIHTLKAMGQTPSRLITRITLHMPSPLLHPSLNNTVHLSKILNGLASRARFGNFKKLDLVWGEGEFAELVQMAKAIPVGRARGYDVLLEGLRTGERTGRFERVVRLPWRDGGEVGWASEGLIKVEEEAVARDLNFAFGGKLYWGERLGWEGWKRVAHNP